MSEAVSALKGASAHGYVTVNEMGLQGMITLRGDLASSRMATAVKAATGTATPKRGHISIAGAKACAWMSPDELLVLVPYEKTGATLDTIAKKLKGEHHLAVEVSDARTMFQLNGSSVREVIAKLCPVDMAKDAFVPGQFRRSRLAQIPAAFWMTDDETAQIICFRSVAQYAFDLLKNASQTGYEVGFY